MPQRDGDADRTAPAGAWRTWLAIGVTGFGGPAGQAAALHREVVERKHWLTEEEFLAALRVCMLLPGPEAQQLATYIGWRLGGTRGGLVAGGLFVLPGAVLVTVLAALHAAGRDVAIVAAAFTGVRPAVVALVGLAAWRIGRKSIRSTGNAALAVVAAAALVWGVPFPAVVAACCAIGWLSTSGRDESVGREAYLHGASVIRHVAIVAFVSVVIWVILLSGVWLTAAAGGKGASIALLFTETTLLSLGGAYTVVPWALDEATARGWLDVGERFAALAAGEATPGPLILVVTFIGFVTGWKADVTAPFLAGLEGAATATAFAFLPSFAMILAVAPAVQAIRAGSRLAQALAGVGAAVVATISMFAFRLAHDAFLDCGQVDAARLAVSAVAVIVLAGGRIPTPIVVLAAAAIGMARAAF